MVKICNESEFEKTDGEGERGKENKRSRACCFVIFDSLPFLLLVRSLVASLRVSSWPTFSNQKSLFLLLDPLPLSLS